MSSPSRWMLAKLAIANNAAYVQKAPTLEASVGAFLWAGENQPPPALVDQPPQRWFYAVTANSIRKRLPGVIPHLNNNG